MKATYHAWVKPAPSCVKAFLEQDHAFRGVVVAEPTGCRAVLEHRGAAACAGEFLGTGGHASAARALEDSAVHEAVRWAHSALAFAFAEEAERYQNLAGIRFNLGVLAGGIKSNMIASSAALRWSFCEQNGCKCSFNNQPWCTCVYPSPNTSCGSPNPTCCPAPFPNPP